MCLFWSTEEDCSRSDGWLCPVDASPRFFSCFTKRYLPVTFQDIGDGRFSGAGGDGSRWSPWPA